MLEQISILEFSVVDRVGEQSGFLRATIVNGDHCIVGVFELRMQ